MASASHADEFPTLQALLEEHHSVEQQMADPALHNDQAKARKVGRRYAELNRVAEAYQRYCAATDDMEAARELAEEDPSFADEVTSLEEQTGQARCPRRYSDAARP